MQGNFNNHRPLIFNRYPPFTYIGEKDIRNQRITRLAAGIEITPVCDKLNKTTAQSGDQLELFKSAAQIRARIAPRLRV